jgi:hypothetical protein
VLDRPERCAETPCVLELPPGTYRLDLENPIAHVGATTTVVVESGAVATVRETLTRPR